MILTTWVQRLLGRLCSECDGAGEVNPSKLDRVDLVRCGACIGTGLRIVQKAEAAAVRHGHPKERRR